MYIIKLILRLITQILKLLFSLVIRDRETIRVTLYSTFLSSHAQLPPLDPWFYIKRTYLRRTRKVFTRGNAVRVTLGPIYISARNLPPRTHARIHAHACTQFLPPWPPENKQNRTLSTNSNSRKGRERGGGTRTAPVRSSRSSFSLFFVRLSKTFRRALQNTARHGSAIRCQNKKFDSRESREKESPSLRAIDLHSAIFPAQEEGARGRRRGGDEEIKGLFVGEIYR